MITRIVQKHQGNACGDNGLHCITGLRRSSGKRRTGFEPWYEEQRRSSEWSEFSSPMITRS